MATTNKVYRISIETDAAQQQLAATSAKLAALDESLQGLDRNSDAAKAIVAEMAKLSKQTSAAENEIDSLNKSLNNIKPGTLPALEAEVEELEAAMRLATVGTAEFDEALLKLGNARGELKKLEDQLDIIADTKQHAAAFVDFANGVAGSFAIAQTAATNFGLGSDSLKEYEARMQSFLVVLSSLEAISKATNSETLGVIKSTYASAKAYLFAGESASTSAKVTRAALVSTGIGILIIGIALLVQNWDRLTSSVKGSEKFFTKVKAIASGLFDSAIASVKNFAGVIGKVFEGDFSGAVAKAKNIGKEVGAAYTKGFQESIFESHRKELEAQIEAGARQIEVLKAQGKATFKQEEQNLLDKLRLQKQGKEDEKKQYLDLQKDLAVLRETNAKKEKEDSQAATLARLDGKIALEQAKGEESFQKQLARERKQLAILQGAADPNAAAIIAQQNKIDTLQAQHTAEQAEKRRAALVLAQQNELAILDKQGQDTLSLRIKFAEQLLALDHDGTEKQRAQRDADHQALLLLEEEYNTKVREGLKENQQQRQDIEAQGRESDKAFIDAAGDYLHEAYTKSLAKVPFDLGTTILTKLFGVKSEDVEKVKGQIAEAYAAISQTVTQVATAILNENISSLDSQISAIQERISSLDQQAQARNQAAQDAENQLATSSGARRDFLIGKINAERAAEAKLLADKQKAAAEEARLAKEKEKSEKQLQAISSATTAAQAIQAGISAVASAATIPFPANIPAILTAIATVGSAVAASRQLGKSFAKGGLIDGPRHSEGGIQMWHSSGAHLGEMEGGEFIINRSATARHRPLLEMINDLGNTRVLPHPSGRFSAGGQVPTTGASLPSGTVTIQQADLSELLETNRAMLAHLGAITTHTANTAVSSQLSAEKPPIVPDHETALAYEQKAREAKQAMADATL